MEWFYANADEHVGPFSDAQMTALVRSGAVSEDTLVWKDGMDAWVPAREAFQPRPTPPPVPGRGTSPLHILQHAPEVRTTAKSTTASSVANGFVDQARQHWTSLSRKQKAVTVVAALAVLIAWQTIGAGEGYMLLLAALTTLAGTTLFSRSSARGRLVALWGVAATGLLSLWALWDPGRIAFATDHLTRADVEVRVLFLMAAAVAVAIMVRKRSEFEPSGDVGGPRPPSRASQETSEASPEGPTTAVASPIGPEPAEVESGTPPVGLAAANLADVPASMDGPGPQDSPTLQEPASPGPVADEPEARGEGSVADGMLHGPRGESRRVAPYSRWSRTDERRDARIRRALILGAAVVLLAVAGWGGFTAYQRSQQAQDRVEALQAAVESARDVRSALAAGRAATDVEVGASRLNDAFGPQGAEHVRRLVDAYAGYERTTQGELRQQVEAKRAEAAQLERRAESARSAMSRFERRAFVVGRRFDTSASGAGMYEAADMTTYRKVVLRIGGDVAEVISPGRQVVLYVESEGEQAVTVTNSTAYRSYETTEYYTVYRVEGASEQVDGLVREIDQDLSSVQSTLYRIEAQLRSTEIVAGEDFWTAVRPVIESLREAD